jgi:hypothetical protein
MRAATQHPDVIPQYSNFINDQKIDLELRLIVLFDALALGQMDTLAPDNVCAFF